jgi:hypothetical protein
MDDAGVAGVGTCSLVRCGGGRCRSTCPSPDGGLVAGRHGLVRRQGGGGAVAPANLPAVVALSNVATGGAVAPASLPAVEALSGVARGGAVAPASLPAVVALSGVARGGAVAPASLPAVAALSGVARGGAVALASLPAAVALSGVARGGAVAPASLPTTFLCGSGGLSLLWMTSFFFQMTSVGVSSGQGVSVGQKGLMFPLMEYTSWRSVLRDSTWLLRTQTMGLPIPPISKGVDNILRLLLPPSLGCP